MKKSLLVLGLLFVFHPTICYGEEIGEFTPEFNFQASFDLTSRYARKQILNGETTRIKAKKDGVYLEFPFEHSPYMSFARFVLNGPVHIYSGFIETIFYRENIKIRDMYYENNPVKTDKIGLYSTDLCFTSEEGTIYHYKNVPYIVFSDKPTVFFSEINFAKENSIISGEIKMPASKNTYQIELFYTDNDEYHYQETSADREGNFVFKLNREAIEGKLYLRASDGLGNYADACDIERQGGTTYQVLPENLKVIEASYKKMKKEKSLLALVKIIFLRFLGIFVTILILLRLRVVLKRHRRKKYNKNR